MIGAIIGDVVGSIYEFHNYKKKDFQLFDPRCDVTDDSLMTIAVAMALIAREPEKPKEDFQMYLMRYMRAIARQYPSPMGGYGGGFYHWLFSEHPVPYNSFGNGSAMRVSAVGDYAMDLDEALELAKQTAEITHNHPEGIKGAQATAAAIYMAKTGSTMDEIKRYITDKFGYNLDRKLKDVRRLYGTHPITCQDTVPEAIIAFLESVSFEDAIRNAVSLGGDSDTLTDITGAIAWAYYGKNGLDDDMKQIAEKVYEYIPERFHKLIRIWEKEFGVH